MHPLDRFMPVKKRKFGKIALTLCAAAILFFAAAKGNVNPFRTVGEVVDSFDGVAVYYNGGVGHVSERNVTPGGYNLGLRYQCVEFVKRYYYERFAHIMPSPWGHAKDFYASGLEDGATNFWRGLVQYRNGGRSKPVTEDIVIFGPWLFNRYGHVAIVSNVSSDSIEIIQQNPGPFGKSRETYGLIGGDETGWRVANDCVLGWLRRLENPR